MTAKSHPARLLKPAATGQFDYPTALVGVSSDNLTTAYSDPSLGTQGTSLAQQVLDFAPQINAWCAQVFGIPCQPHNVIIAPLSGSNDGSGGAYHYGCDFASGGTLYLDAAFNNPQLDLGLFIAELTECFMGAQAKGWDCGGSGGEALSRVMAEMQSGGPEGALKGFASAPVWDQAGRPNWIDNEESTDQDYNSIGCGVVYLYWLVSLDHGLASIVQAGCPSGTLASNYLALTGKSTGWADMSAALKGLAVTSDDPFGQAPAPQPTPNPQPVPAPVPAKTVSSVVLTYSDGSTQTWLPVVGDVVTQK